MIHIYRTIWLLFYFPIFIIELILFVIGILLFSIGCIIYFIKCGDIEETPDWMVPGKLSVLLDYWYKGLLDSFEKL